MRVRVTVEEMYPQGDERDDVPGIVATCQRCQHSTESFGTEERSIRRCLALLREECLRGEQNFYIEGKLTPGELVRAYLNDQFIETQRWIDQELH